MLLELFVARRFAKSLRRDVFTLFTTSVTTMSIALGYAAICIAISVLQGYSSKITETATRFTGDIQIRSQLSPDYDNTIALQQELRRMPEIAGCVAILERESLVKHGEHLDGIMLQGIPAERYASIADVVSKRDQGSPLTAGLVLGSGAARTLHASVGDTLTLIMQQRGSQTPAVRRTRLVGVFQSGMGLQDDNIGFVHIDSLQSFCGVGSDVASFIMAHATNEEFIDTLTNRINERYKPLVFAVSYRDVFQGVWSWIELQRKPIPIVLGLIAIVAVVSIVSALFLAIVQKTQSMAILITLGMSSHRIGWIIIMRAVASSTVGVLVGLAVTLLFVTTQSSYGWIKLDSNLYYVSVLPVQLNIVAIILIGIGIILLTAIVALIPMMVARRITPVRALRFS